MKDSKHSGWSICLAFLLIFTVGCDWFEEDDDPVVEPPSSINTLASLSISEGTLSPAFSSDQTNYSVDLDSSIDSITLTATTDSNLASMTLNGNALISGTTSAPIMLETGANQIDIIVTAENGDARTTSLTVNRASPPELSVLLTSLQLSDIEFTPAFDAETTMYTATVSGDIESTVMTALAEDDNATIYYGSQGPLASGTPSDPIVLAVGENNLAVEVHAADDSEVKTYYVNVTRQAPISDIATLDNLQISDGTLSPSFDGQTYNYSASVGFEVESISVTPQLTDENASVTINATAVSNGQASSPIALAEGENTITISVTAENGITSETYTILITRQAAAVFAQSAYIKASNTGQQDNFGWAVAIDGDTLAIGASREASLSSGVNGDETNNESSYVGAVYVFVKENDEWSQQAYLKASNPDQNDRFGNSLDLSGDTLIVGAHRESSDASGINGDDSNNNSPNSGAAYIFVRESGTWTQQAYLKASNADSNDQFGFSVAIDGDTAAASAWYESSSATGVNGNELNNDTNFAGAAYIFVRNGTTWTQQAYIKASNTSNTAYFGFDIALDDDTLAVGARGERSGATGINGDQSDNSTSQAGAVYVFSRSGSSWSQDAYIKASNTGAGDKFGTRVKLNNDMLLVGAPDEDSSATGIDGDETNNDVINSGAAYLFTRVNGSWAQQAYIKASNTGREDQFGYSLALSNNKMAIGSFFEDGSGTGVLQEEQAGRVLESGAVYVFEGANDDWQQIAYVKASNTGDGDLFGTGVGLTDEYMIVGAYQEDSSATGVNGGQNDNTVLDSGAAYLFTLGRVAEGDSDASLANLSLNAGSLSPSFSSNTFDYSAEVAFSQTEIQVMASASNSAASITINSVAVNSGELSSPISLQPGENSITVEVVAADGVTTNSYTIAVTRASEANDDASLSALSLSAGTLSPAFNSSTFNYVTNVDYSSTNISVTATLSDPFASMTVNGNETVSGEASAMIELDEGENIITIEIIAEDFSTSETYAVTVTRESATQFAQRAYLKASNTNSDDRFGYSTALSGNTLVVGAPYESSASVGINSDQTDNNARGAGAAYVFVKDGSGNWSQQAYLKASNTDVNDRFGIDVAIDGDTIAIGADQERSNALGVNGDQTNNGITFAGAVYVYTRSGTTWSQQAYIKAATNFAFNYFGASLSIDGDRLVVGSIGGIVTTYTRNAGVWSFEAELFADNFDSNDRFGAAVDLDGDTMIIGAYLEDGSSNSVDGADNDDARDAGAAYIFTFSNGVWTQQAYLKASNSEANDLFGFSVAIDGDLCIVGATQESSSATGINGDGGNNNANQSGAVYVFSRTGTTWTQQSYIKASNTGASDLFGTSVDINGTLILVGAQWEASSATGANGDQSTNTLLQAGAVYLLESTGIGDWLQTAYIKASNTNAGDYFGRSVTLSDSEIVVGADVEDSDATGINGDQNSNAASNAGAVYILDVD